jgi:hypothetical protein
LAILVDDRCVVDHEFELTVCEIGVSLVARRRSIAFRSENDRRAYCGRHQQVEVNPAGVEGRATVMLFSAQTGCRAGSIRADEWSGP